MLPIILRAPVLFHFLQTRLPLNTPRYIHQYHVHIPEIGGNGYFEIRRIIGMVNSCWAPVVQALFFLLH